MAHCNPNYGGEGSDKATGQRVSLLKVKQKPDPHIAQPGVRKKKAPADTEQAVSCWALDPFTRRLPRSIHLSIVKSFRRGLEVSHWSDILTWRGLRSACTTHLHVIFTHHILLKAPVIIAQSFKWHSPTVCKHTVRVGQRNSLRSNPESNVSSSGFRCEKMWSNYYRLLKMKTTHKLVS